MKAEFTRLVGSDEFLAALDTLTGPLDVAYATHQKGDSLQGAAVKAVAAQFLAKINHLPFDLTFRTYDELHEVAWYGTEGVAVTLSEVGELDVGDRIKLKETSLSSNVYVREIVRDGRIIYRKLEPERSGGTDALRG